MFRVRQSISSAVFITALSLSLSGCQFAIGNTSMWLRPAMRIAPRSVDKGDGEQIYMEKFDPEGDSMFIVLRFYPGGEENQSKLTNSKFRDWPTKIKERITK